MGLGNLAATAPARACILAFESEKMKSFEAFNVIAPTTAQDTPSKDLAAEYYPKAEIGGVMSSNQAFWTTDKGEKECWVGRMTRRE
jgi:hypothetical protein